MPCRIKRQQEWTTRLMMEYIYQGKKGAFVTLTYDPLHLPDSKKYVGGNLYKSEIQKFLKRFRKYYGTGRRVSYFAVGEYGEKSSRAHYHLCIFGVDAVVTERITKKCWTKGHSMTVGLDKDGFERMRYTCQYTLKKMTSDKDFTDGRNPEFSLMSRKPSLGLGLLPSYAPRLLKHNFYPSGGMTFHQKWYINKHYPHLRPWNGCFKLQGKWFIMDKYLRTKLFEIMYETELNEYDEYNKETIRLDASFIARRDCAIDDRYLNTMKFIAGEDYAKEIEKTKKLERKAKNKVKISAI